MSDLTEIGPFVVGEQIGQGGMGTVYRGIHRRTQIPVAIKVIRKISDESARHRFHSEVQSHARLNHPGIVHLFEYGEIEAGSSGEQLLAGSPYVAMEFAEKGTVRHGFPLSDWPSIRRLLAAILEALAYAHSRGVIHRDLKLENFLCFGARDGTGVPTVKLADFGIAHALGSEFDSDEESLRSVAGTPLYMAPEQLRGRWRRFGPWTDLYALGCITWELVCRRPPFAAPTAAALALKHLTEERPPLEPEIGVPTGLEDWIHRAMSIDEEARFRRAADALSHLPDEEAVAPSSDRGGGEASEFTESLLFGDTLFLSDAQTTPVITEDLLTEYGGGRGQKFGRSPMDEQREVPPDWRPPARPNAKAKLVDAGTGLFGLREAPFVNRQDECDRIWSALKRAISSETLQMVLVSGTVGTGKSRLVQWMSMRAHELGVVNVVRADHLPAGGGLTEGLRASLEQVFRTAKLGRKEVFDILLDRLARLPGGDVSDEQEARALTEYLRPTIDHREHTEGPRYHFASAQSRYALIARILQRLSRRRPLYLWLDDLQWGGESLDVLEYLAQHRVRGPIVVVSTLRSDVVAERPQLRDRLARLRDEEFCQEVSLAPLERRYHQELLCGLLPLQQGLAKLLVERTEGRPLFAMQLLSHWIDSGSLEVGESGFEVVSGEEVALPGELHDLWMARIERLLKTFDQAVTERIVEALELAAALGRDVVIKEWHRLLPEGHDTWVPVLLERLAGRGLIERGEQKWSFAHGLLVESLARQAREENRWARHHRKCAEYLASLPMPDELGPRERVAAHWAAAGEPERGLRLLLDEIELAAERNANEERLRLTELREQFLEDAGIPRIDPPYLEQRVEWARIHGQRYELDRAREILLEVQESIDDTQHLLAARLAANLAEVENFRGNYQKAQQWVERGLEEATAANSESLRVDLLRKWAWLHHYRGDVDGAAAVAARARQLAHRLGDQYAKLSMHLFQGLVQLMKDSPQASEIFEEVHREAGEAGYVALQARALNGLGEIARFAGEYDRAYEYYDHHLSMMKELDRPLDEATARLNLSMVELQRGNFDEGLSHLEMAETIHRIADSEHKLVDLRHLIRLTHSAAIGQEDSFHRYWEPLADGWPSGWALFRDHPWLLEKAVQFARQSGWKERADQVEKLSRRLWERLE